MDKRLAQDLPYIWVSLATWSLTGSDSVMNFNNLTLPDGSHSLGFANGVLDPTPVWRKA